MKKYFTFSRVVSLAVVLVLVGTVSAVARLVDLTNIIRHNEVFETAVVTADQNGTAVDLKNFTEATFYVLVGAAGDSLSASINFLLEVEDSADNSSFSDVSDAELSSSVTGTNTGTFAKIDADSEAGQIYTTTYKGSERYVRVVINEEGTNSTGTPFGIIGFQVGAEQLPITQ